MRARLVLFATLAFVLAGCLDAVDGEGGRAKSRLGVSNTTDPREIVPQDWHELAIPMGPGHSHQDLKQHANLSTPNFDVLGFEPLITDYYGRTAGDYFCGDVKEKDGRKLSVVHSWGSDVAFVLADVTDPTNPQKVGELVMANTQVYDIAVSPDLNYVIMSTSPFDSGPDQPGQQASPQTLEWTDACTGESWLLGPESGLPYTSGVVLVDITNVRAPVVTDFRQLPVIGSHSVHADLAKGLTIVTVSVDNGASTASYYAFFEIRSTPAGPKLFLDSVFNYVPEEQSKLPPTVGIHMDGVVREHPITHQRLAYLAMRGAGLTIVNLDDPMLPTFVSNFRPFPMGIHSVLPLSETWDEGVHYTILGEECGGRSRGNPSCLIIVVDTTDPARPRYVSAWTIPVDVQWTQGLEFSMHYYDLVNRTLFVTTYHGGLWAIDLSTPEAIKTLRTIGVFMPDRESPKPISKPMRSAAGNALFTVAGTRLDDRPTLSDVVATSDGVLTTWDSLNGLYTLRFDASSPAPPPEPWKLNGVPGAGD